MNWVKNGSGRRCFRENAHYVYSHKVTKEAVDRFSILQDFEGV